MYDVMMSVATARWVIVNLDTVRPVGSQDYETEAEALEALRRKEVRLFTRAGRDAALARGRRTRKPADPASLSLVN